jgi:hypothetical protein
VAPLAVGFGTLAVLLAACGGASDAPPSGSSDGGTKGPTPDSSAPSNGDDSGSPQGDDSGSSSQSDSSTLPSGEEGGVTRNTSCTPLSAQTGTLVNTDHGRLDGTLVYVLPVDGSYKCNGDDSHVHLQIEVSGLVYDVAVDIGSELDGGLNLVGMYQETVAVPGGVWAEGWHGTDTLAYQTLSLKSTSFPTADPSTIATQVETLLENTSKISIFCTGYQQGDGCHDVHYKNGTSEDGAIVLDPTSATSPMLFFRFATQNF